ncbi:export-oriented ABC transporter, permease and ATP binding components [Psychroflexus torquis ATCC 700755]|uniref:Export-oriented ABC transporter, permease and ATP binding components n=1 Tax=Psychroflexus torquis (strain ATCC 700755 / CIP 106069 / ACAM 623) TaxID=313595 RepID=K4IF28_PSYTT|nr:ABC transporter ATP-binding protein [Psychroflexus torquis]AFU67696.1 export-oriented ABC transporter, permease and ATP binding components [Psychroflexus torquis ATCC 700755]
MKALLSLNKYLYKYRGRLLLGIIITMGARVFAVFTPQLIRNSTVAIEDYLNGDMVSIAEVREELLINIGLIIGAALASGALTFLMRQTFIVVSRYIEYDLKNEVYTQYQNLSLDFYKRNRTGDLMNRISEDVSKVRMYVGPALMYGVQTLTLFVVVIYFMIKAAPTLTLYTLIPFPILSFAIYKLSMAINKRSAEIQRFLSLLNTYTQESFSGIAVIKSYGILNRFNSDFEKLSNESKDKNVNLVKVEAFFFPLMILLIGFSNLFVIYFGGMQYINGEIESVGVIVEFLLYVNMLTWPVASVGWITSMVQRAEASQERINEFLSETPNIKNNSPESSEDILGEIEFKNVSFTYEDTNIVALKNLSFKVKKGETFVIMGKTGSGKSTILELIGRLYDVNNGEILIDGRPIESYNLNELRKQLGYVPQDAFLFSSSIRDNIKFGKVNANEEDIVEAAKNAAVHNNIIGFSKGYDTILGERGITLSGGQKQRVSIARAIIKDPKIVLFDDCLSAVDTETEEEIFNKLDKVSNHKTSIVVSHRASSAKNANHIIILDEGVILEEGTHSELLAYNGYYKDLYNKQLSEKEN